MTFVNITALTFPDGAQDEIEQRFALRQKGVDDERRGMSVDVMGFDVVQRDD